MTIELDPQLHLRRAYQKIDQEKADGTFPLDSDDEQNKSEKERTAASTETVHRLADALVMLGQGVAVGAFAGTILGALYAFRTRSPAPIGVTAHSAIVLGLMGGQFVGIRNMLPIGLERFYWRYIASEDEKELEIPISATWSLPGLDLPSFFQDMTERDTEIAKSMAAGAASGYLMARLRASDIARHLKTGTGHVHANGLRGGIVWSFLMGAAHWLYYRFDDWRQEKIISSKLRRIYEQHEVDAATKFQQTKDFQVQPAMNMAWNADRHSLDVNEEQLKALQVEQERQRMEHVREALSSYGIDPSAPLPEKEKVVGMTWREIIQDPGRAMRYYDIDIARFLPMVHSQDEYEYRQYLESKVRLLSDEVEILEKLYRRRARRIQEMRSKPDGEEAKGETI